MSQAKKDAIKELNELSWSKKIRSLRGNAKRFYKLFLIKMFADAIYDNYHHFNHTCESVNWMLKDKGDAFLSQLESETKRNKLFNQDKNRIETSYLFNINDNNLDDIIEFIRKYSLSYIKEEKTLYEFSELSFFIKDVVGSVTTILPHMWVDLNPFEQKPIITFPEYFAYQDMVNLWNDVLDKETTIKKITKERGVSRQDRELRSLNYSQNTSLRMSVIAATNFVEGYLYYYYYNVRSMNKYPQNTLLKELKIRSITDKRIFKDLIEKEYSLPSNCKRLYKQYGLVVDLRDRIVHLSAFKDDQFSHSQLQPLLNITIQQIATMLGHCVEFVLSIEEFVDGKILFWWDFMEYPEFDSFEKVSNLIKK